jgi:hypothetical protein
MHILTGKNVFLNEKSEVISTVDDLNFVCVEKKAFKCVEMCSFMHKIVHFLFFVCCRRQKMKKLNCIVYALLVSLINASAGVWNNLQQRLPPKAAKFLTFSDTKTCLFLFELCSCCYWFVERQNVKQTNTIV